MAVRLQDIADRLGISVATVSRALGGYSDISLATRQRVLQAAQEAGYRPNVVARMLQKQRTDTIGFIVPTHGPRFSDPFFSELFAGIGNKATEAGFDLLVSTHPPGPAEMEAYKRLVMERRVDGVLVVRTRRQDPRLAYLLEQDFPVVAFGRSELDGDFPYVDVDGKVGMHLLIEHLVSLGHRRIALISPPPDFLFTYWRLEGYRECLQEHGIEYREELVKGGTLTERGGYDAGMQLLTMPVPPTAIAACNDLMALGVTSAAQTLGLTVGQDVAVTGFDDVPLAEHAHPPLTTVRQPIYQIGQRICDMLIRLLQDKPLTERHVMLEPELIVRVSCGAPGTQVQKGGSTI